MKYDLSIIIPAYNAKNTISKTLMSIAMQITNYKFDVTIVNDASDYDYQDEINRFSKYVDIKEIKLEENSGPGVARQKGIDETSSDYIMFIDSDDYLYKVNSVDTLLGVAFENNSDMLISSFIKKRDGIEEVMKNDFIWLHGKIYKREFLNANNVRFNNTRANEDNGFNRLILSLKPRRAGIRDITYIYEENPNSITRSNNRSYKLYGLEGFAINMLWVVDELIKRNIDEKTIKMTTLSSLTAGFYFYNDLINEENVSLIYTWFKDIYNRYLGYEYTESELRECLFTNKSILPENTETSISFEEFLKGFEV